MNRRQRRTVGVQLLGLLLLGCILAGAAGAGAQGVVPRDWCGCEGVPNLGDFVSSDPATWPVVEGQPTVRSGNLLIMPLPEDGTLIFESFTLDDFDTGENVTLIFTYNAANSPPTVLSVGDVLIGSGDIVSVAGHRTNAGSSVFGGGRPGGPGGFRGGDGIYFPQFPDNISEAGAGPGGGAPRVGGTTSGAAATYVASFLPLVGGSGGSGGSCTRTDAGAAGGGGGGGGAFLAVSNTSFRIDGTINARGAGGGSGFFFCPNGGPGSGGTIRILGTEVAGTGVIDVSGGSSANPGKIRIEALSNVFGGAITPPSRLTTRGAPGPLRNPLSPTVSITSVAGEVVVSPTLGWRGPDDRLGPHIDVLVPSAGPVDVTVRTRGVPSGTTVNVTVKPRPGATRTASILLDACDAAGTCDAFTTFDLAEGDYTIEARATFAP